MKSKTPFTVTGRQSARALSRALCLFFILSADLWARDVYFNPAALELDNSDQPASIDLSVFEQGGNLGAGDYSVQLYVNGQYMATDTVRFVVIADSRALKPLLSGTQLKTLGIMLPVTIDQDLLDLTTNLPASSFDFEEQKLRLKLSIPQSSLEQRPRDYVDPNSWDQGINALTVNYIMTGFSSHAKNNGVDNTDSYYLNLRSGLNLGPWRLRNYSTYQDGASQQGQWDNIQLYAQRDIHAIRSQLTIGDSNTPSNLFDSFFFRGIQLASDDGMRPDSLRGFAPVVRGIAMSNAHVTVRQNNYVIYEQDVPPGPFEISDLYQIATGANLEVTITESNGEQRTLIYNSAAVPIMEREGNFDYSITAGKYRSMFDDIDPQFVQVGVIYGLPYEMTVYGGAQLADHYKSGMFGIGKSLGTFGAVSVDATYAQSDITPLDEVFSGQRYRAQYAKLFESTDTSLSVLLSRYSKEPYYSFTEAAEYGIPGPTDLQTTLLGRKDHYQLSLTQYLGKYGNVFVNANSQSYWDTSDRLVSIQAGYSYTGYGNISVTLSFSHARDLGDATSTNQVSLGIHVPLDSVGLNRAGLAYQVTKEDHGQTAQSVSLMGTALENGNLGYALQKNYVNQGEGDSFSASTNYLGSKGQVNLGYSNDAFADKFNYGLSGGIVLHSGGVTLSQPLGETIALVDTQGVEDVPLRNKTTVSTDWAGYAILPSVEPYRRTQVNIDVNNLAADIDTPRSTVGVTPTRGAVVRADLGVRQGQKVLATVNFNNHHLPFGTSVIATDNSGETLTNGIVGEHGEVYLSGLPDRSTITASWGQGQQCSTALSLPKVDQSSPIYSIDVNCH